MNQRGLSLFEMMVAVSATAFAASMAWKVVRAPTLMMQQSNRTVALKLPYQALDLVVNDLKEAEAGSFPFASINPVTGAMDWFTRANMQGSPPFIYVQYRYEPMNSFSGVLTRYVNTGDPVIPGATATVILENVVPPGAGTPLFARDPDSPNVLIITVATRPSRLLAPGSPRVIRTVRRVSVRSGV